MMAASMVGGYAGAKLSGLTACGSEDVCHL